MASWWRMSSRGSNCKPNLLLKVLRTLRERVCQKWPELWKNKLWILHQDYAPAYNTLSAKHYLAARGTPVLEHIKPAWFSTLTKFNFEQLLFKAFFDVMRIFGSVEPQTESAFLFLNIIIFQRGESFKAPTSTPRGDRHMSSRTF